MKKLLPIIALTASLAASAFAEEKIAPGPLGGRLLALDGQKAEFFVEPDRTVVVAFYDDALKKVAPAGQVVTVTADAPSGRARLDFKPAGDVLKSTAPLPEGENYLIVLQIRPSADAKPKNFRITYLAHKCSECGRVEYACICNH
jgi:hypothetical protein